MRNAGIISQAGFEFQKYTFIYHALQIGITESVTYEGKDDIEVVNELPIARIATTFSNELIQVKSGEVSQETLEKIFMNWLLLFDATRGFKCILENNLTIDYKDVSFAHGLIEKIKSCPAKTRKDAIMKMVQTKYSISGTYADLAKDLKALVESSIFEVCSATELYDKSFAIYRANYHDESINDIICIQRFKEVVRNFRDNIADALLSKKAFSINHNKLFNLISEVHERISETRFDPIFSVVKDNPANKAKVCAILERDSDSVRQLRLVNTNIQFILSRLAEQVFYEDLREFFYEIEKKHEVDNLELLAYENYQSVLMEIKDSGDHLRPFSVYDKTTKNVLQSSLFKTYSSNTPFYSKGCYIHLTDSDVDENIKIKWGEENE